MGEDSEAVLATAQITDKDRADFSKVLEKFDEVWKDLVFEHAMLIKHTSIQKNQLNSSSQGFTYLLIIVSLEIY